jgi:hypothetical protein
VLFVRQPGTTAVKIAITRVRNIDLFIRHPFPLCEIVKRLPQDEIQEGMSEVLCLRIKRGLGEKDVANVRR